MNLFPNSPDPNRNRFDEFNGPREDDPYNTGLDSPESVSPEMKRMMSKGFWLILAAGLGVGVVVAIGVVAALDRLGLTGVPDANPPGQSRLLSGDRRA